MEIALNNFTEIGMDKKETFDFMLRRKKGNIYVAQYLQKAIVEKESLDTISFMFNQICKAHKIAFQLKKYKQPWENKSSMIIFESQGRGKLSQQKTRQIFSSFSAASSFQSHPNW